MTPVDLYRARLSRQIRAKRLALGISQERAAALAGVHEHTVALIENGADTKVSTYLKLRVALREVAKAPTTEP